MDKMIEIKNVTKKYGNQTALDQISLTINKGDIVGFLGTNGAGKSTLMNIIAGYFYMTEGTVKVNGLDIVEKADQVKKDIGYLPEIPPLYMDMTVYDYLKFVSKLKEIPKKDIKAEVQKKMDIVNISHVRNRVIKNLSKGYKQRVGLAQATLGNPSILILDEPTVGLDPREMIEIRKLIQDVSKSSTVILSSHILSEVSALCNKIMIIDKGKHIVTGSPNELAQKINNGSKIVMRIKGEEQKVSACIAELEGIEKVETLEVVEPGTVEILLTCSSETDIRELVSITLAKNNLPILMMKNFDITLEETFLQLTSNAGGDL